MDDAVGCFDVRDDDLRLVDPDLVALNADLDLWRKRVLEFKQAMSAPLNRYARRQMTPRPGANRKTSRKIRVATSTTAAPEATFR